jgi:hypothetical protein
MIWRIRGGGEGEVARKDMVATRGHGQRGEEWRRRSLGEEGGGAAQRIRPPELGEEGAGGGHAT